MSAVDHAVMCNTFCREHILYREHILHREHILCLMSAVDHAVMCRSWDLKSLRRSGVVSEACSRVSKET